MAAAATATSSSGVGGFIKRAITSSLGAKVVMAVTGLLFYAWLIAHVAGNLAIFAGAEMMNKYAHFLKSTPELLWPMRIGLLVIVLLHIFSGLRLYALNKRARPSEYRYARNYRQASLASRTMAISGLIAFGFIIFHLLHFTGGVVLSEYFANTPTDPTQIPDVYSMVVKSFQVPWVVAIYVVAMAIIGFHLSHGVWSALQTLGLNGKRFTPFAQRFGFAIGVGLAILFALIPIAIATRMVDGGNETASTQSASSNSELTVRQ